MAGYAAVCSVNVNHIVLLVDKYDLQPGEIRFISNLGIISGNFSRSFWQVSWK